MDATAMRVLETLNSHAAAAGGNLVVVLTCPRARRLLEVVTVSGKLPVVGNIPEAMAAGR